MDPSLTEANAVVGSSQSCIWHVCDHLSNVVNAKVISDMYCINVLRSTFMHSIDHIDHPKPFSISFSVVAGKLLFELIDQDQDGFEISSKYASHKPSNSIVNCFDYPVKNDRATEMMLEDPVKAISFLGTCVAMYILIMMLPLYCSWLKLIRCQSSRQPSPVPFSLCPLTRGFVPADDTQECDMVMLVGSRASPCDGRNKEDNGMDDMGQCVEWVLDCCDQEGCGGGLLEYDDHTLYLYLASEEHVLCNTYRQF